MRARLGRLLALLAFGLGGASVAPAAVVDAVFDGRIACIPRDGVQFCAGDVDHRVPTWDGVPLDVNVTLPPADLDGPFPLIIDEHGWGAGKNGLPAVGRALAGYVVLSHTARGFHASCGSEASRLADPDGCERGWTHLADARYEVRDVQHLAGLLVDEGLVVPDRIGVTGVSYGGGRTVIAAALRDRVMLPDGMLVPWTSPLGTPMAIAAGAAIVPWSDMSAALTPNGATLDFRTANPFGTRAGVRKEAYNDALFASGLAAGFYAPLGADPRADLRAWDARARVGEPYDASSAVQAIIDQLTTYHSGYYVDDSVPPAPLFIYNAWTDDLFPADEGLRFWRKTSARHPDAELALLFADDFGHPRAALAFGVAPVFERVDAFLARHLLGDGPPLAPFEVYTQGCNGAPALGPFTADDWDALRPGEVRFADPRAQTFDQDGGDPAVAAALNPLTGGPCRSRAAMTDPGAATWVLPAAAGDGYTLLGSPTVVADLVVTGPEYAQVAGRLWDVAPDDQQTLVTQGFFRPRSDNLGPQVFQLPPNGWRFAPGHAPKLELLGQSAPAGRASNGPFTVTVTGLELRLPVREAPDGAQVLAPAALVLPPDDAEPPRCADAPRAECHAATRGARLAIIRGRKAAKDELTWAWQGEAPFDPETGPGPGGATLCVWDGEGVLALAGPAPSSGTCGAKSCWSATAKRTRYRDAKRVRTGVATLTLTRKGSRTRVRLRAAGVRLGPPPLPLAAPPVVVQLHGGDGACWGATFEDVRRNAARRFTARGS